MVLTDIGSAVGSVSQFIFVATMVFGGQAFARRIHDLRTRADARRIRAMLRLSFAALRELYADNLRKLENAESPLLSGRNQMVLLRMQLPRLTLLEREGEVEAVLAANIAMEAAETAMTVAGKPLGGVAFTMPEDGTGTAAIGPLLEQACDALETALAILTPHVAAPERGRFGFSTVTLSGRRDSTEHEAKGSGAGVATAP